MPPFQISSIVYCVQCLYLSGSPLLVNYSLLFLDENLLRNSPKKPEDPAQQVAGDGPQLSEFVVSVSAVLETTGVDHAAKSRVMNVVNRLVDRLHRAEEEKDTAALQLKGRSQVSHLTSPHLCSVQGWRRGWPSWRRSWRSGAW